MELYERRGDPIPEGWGCDAQGQLTTEPKRVLSGGGLVPLGGSEATGQEPVDKTVGVKDLMRDISSLLDCHQNTK